MFDKQKETAKQLRREGTLVHVETTEAAADRPPRRRLWVPKKNTDNDEMIPDGDTTAAEIVLKIGSESQIRIGKERRSIGCSPVE
jgi:hypothetical protein